jgi:hypothetical protein
MNTGGQLAGVGVFLTTVIALIVGLVLITDGISEPVGLITNTIHRHNVTYTFPANQSTVTLEGQANRNVVLQNATLSNITGLVPTTNYSIENYVILADGTLGSRLRAAQSNYNSRSVNITSDLEPLGYDTNSGNRTIIGMIVLFSALSVVVVALVPTFRDGFMDLVEGIGGK